jgi:epoxyqueuosine reductase
VAVGSVEVYAANRRLRRRLSALWRSTKRKLYRLVDWPIRQFPIHTIRTKLWLVPPLMGWRRRRYLPPMRGWLQNEAISVPPALLTQPGIRRDRAEEARVEERDPLRSWLLRHVDTLESIFRWGWAYQLPMAPRRFRLERAAQRLAAVPPAAIVPADDPAELTREVKELAATLGINACGIAAYDTKYTFLERQKHKVGERIVVCVLESNWAATQKAPSALAEKAQLAANVELSRRMLELEKFLKSRGYKVRQSNHDHVILHYAVESGLGQLGVNGQVLTPFAGSRCRFATLDTDAPLLLDGPVDFGVPPVCDACQVCVRRCPSGAIPKTRALYRGVEKAKINTARCAPTVAKAHHCAVCMKVCPVQRYGLQPVLDEFARSGRILGKDTNELEEYVFEGRLYEVGERPKLKNEWFTEIPYEDEARAARRAKNEPQEKELSFED